MAGPAPASASLPLPPERAGGSRLPWVLTTVLVVLTVLALFVGNGNLGLALAPCLLVAAVWGACVLPLRHSLLTLLALAWLLDAPNDAFAAGKVALPWRQVGAVLWGKLNLLVPVPALVITGFDLVALFLFGLLLYRHLHRLRIDRTGWADVPAPLTLCMWLCLAAVIWMSAYGMARGGSFRFVLWQSVRWLYLPVVFFLMRHGLRGPSDARALGKVLLVVGVIRAAEAIVIRLLFPSVEDLPHATTHHDSVLFALCTGILVALLIEVPTRKTFAFTAVLFPVFAWAMDANNRRLVWAEVALVLLVFWVMTPWRPLKRKLARLMVHAAVPLFLYLAVGWNARGAIFSPVHKLRSMTDSSANSSTLWRDLENFNLVFTYRDSPLLGSGFGHPFVERIRLPDVTAAYELEPYVPHNSVLGLWAFGGLLGFFLLWMVFPVGMYFTARAYRWSRTPLERVTLLGAAAAQVCYTVQGYGDLGFGTWGPLFTVAAALALAGKMAVSSGAWVPAPAFHSLWSGTHGAFESSAPPGPESSGNGMTRGSTLR